MARLGEASSTCRNPPWPSVVSALTDSDATVTALTTLTRIGTQAVAAHDAQFDLPPDDLARLSADLAARLSEHQPVLDAGCGSGLMLVPLRRAGLKVVGVDIDLDMISAALSREPRLRTTLPSLTWPHSRYGNRASGRPCRSCLSSLRGCPTAQVLSPVPCERIDGRWYRPAPDKLE